MLFGKEVTVKFEDVLVDSIKPVIQGLVDDPKKVEFKFAGGAEGDSVLLEIKVPKSDLGKVIGKEGRNIGAVRIIANALAAKNGKKLTIMVDESRASKDNLRKEDYVRRY